MNTSSKLFRTLDNTAPAANRPMFQLFVGALLAGTLLTASPAEARTSPERSAARATEALRDGKVDRAIPHAEAAVRTSPQSADYRGLLAGAYLKDGRFLAASQAFESARALGDESPRTALSLALSYVATGQSADALDLLAEVGNAIPAGDLGLATALAGQPARGVQILSQELQNGNNVPKIRQNLAFAMALNGQWREARLMMSQDVAPDQVDGRISDWALMAAPEAYQKRVAALLGVPVRTDTGMPAALALLDMPAPAVPSLASYADATPVGVPPIPAMASEELPAVDTPAYADAVVAAAVEVAPVAMASTELPAVDATGASLAAPSADVLASLGAEPATAEAMPVEAPVQVAVAESSAQANWTETVPAAPAPVAVAASEISQTLDALFAEAEVSAQAAAPADAWAQAAPVEAAPVEVAAAAPVVAPAESEVRIEVAQAVIGDSVQSPFGAPITAYRPENEQAAPSQVPLIKAGQPYRVAGEYAEASAELPAIETETQEVAAVSAAAYEAEPETGMDAPVAYAAAEFTPAEVVSYEVVQPIPARTAEVQAARAPARAPAPRPARAASAAPAAVSGGTHVVQLGAFSTQAAARAAWTQFAARNRALANFRMVTTNVTVNGRQLWRVSAAGFDGARAANSMCSSLRANGAACLVLTAPREAAPGANPTRMAAAGRR